MTAILTRARISIRELVEVASWAPSAENLQPWRFQVEANRLTVCLDRKRTLASEIDSMLTLTGIGACLENAAIACRRQGYEPAVSFLRPDSHAANEAIVPVARLEPGESTDGDPLYPYLTTRCTCRRMKRPYAVDENALSQLSAAAESFDPVQIDWVTDRRQIKELAALVGLGNRLRFEHAAFHEEFYANVRFSRQDAERTQDGLDARTLQVPAASRGVLRLLRTWPRTRIANRLGFSRVVQRQACGETCCSAALGVLTVGGNDQASFVEGGRALQRLWLTATALGLGLHPAASVAVFKAYAGEPHLRGLSPKHQRLISTIRERFNALLPHLRDRTVQMVFRIGHADPPRVKSMRRPLGELLRV